MLVIRLAGFFIIYLEILRNTFLVPGKSFTENRTPAHMEGKFLMCRIADWHLGELCPCPRCITALLGSHGEVIPLSSTTASPSEKYE